MIQSYFINGTPRRTPPTFVGAIMQGMWVCVKKRFPLFSWFSSAPFIGRQHRAGRGNLRPLASTSLHLLHSGNRVEVCGLGGRKGQEERTRVLELNIVFFFIVLIIQPTCLSGVRRQKCTSPGQIAGTSVWKIPALFQPPRWCLHVKCSPGNM